MSLTSLWRESPSHLKDLHVRQVIGFAGDGRLLDGNPTSEDFRAYLAEVPSSVLARYADECLSEAFQDSGLALQDIVNEMGRRLGFTVTNGRYRGTGGHIGNDGLWHLRDGRSIIVEVKTTDAYRIPLDTIASYRKELAKKGTTNEDSSSILIVVGRADTGDLEAQIRGSRHAWEMRLISVDSLVRLMNIKEEAVEDPETVKRIHEMLIPKEFTKLDEIVDLLFSTAEEAKQAETLELEQPEEQEERPKKFTPVTFNEACVARIAEHLGKPILKRTRATFSSPDGELVLICAVSKTHQDAKRDNYWFAFHPHQQAVLADAHDPYVAFGCGSPATVFLLPFNEFSEWLPGMNMTEKDGRYFWHVQIYREPGGFMLVRKKGESKIELDKYLLPESTQPKRT